MWASKQLLKAHPDTSAFQNLAQKGHLMNLHGAFLSFLSSASFRSPNMQNETASFPLSCSAVRENVGV